MTAGQTTLTLTSPAFEPGQRIPTEYTKDGRNISPSLFWGEVPPGTESLALICEDPDAPRGMFAHWVAFNLPAGTRSLPAGVPTEPTLPDGTVQGTNDTGTTGYTGPAPPPGKPHRYFFHLYALETRLRLPAGVSREQLMVAIQEARVMGKGELMGTYGRSGG